MISENPPEGCDVEECDEELPMPSYNPLIHHMGCHHLPLRHQCGICGGLFASKERFIGLLGSRHSASYKTHTRPNLFPDIALDRRLLSGGLWTCLPGECTSCATNNTEGATAHFECFELFRQTCKSDEAPDRLWRVAAWRWPWSTAPEVVLPEETVFPRGVLTRVAEAYGMPRLAPMPAEIIALIREHSANSLFWRLASALDLAARLDAVATNEGFTMPLCKVLSWERGSQLVTSTHRLPLIRPTIDSRGIKTIERLRNKPRDGKRYDHLVFMVHDVASLAGVTARLKDGLLRLEVPDTRCGLEIWDTPTPPSLQLPGMYRIWPFPCPRGPWPPQARRFCTTDMASTRGLTFFFGQGGWLFAIHGHTHARPAAVLWPPPLTVVCWVYVPIATNDQILAFAVRDPPRRMEPCSFSLRTKLAGDIAIGHWQQGGVPKHVLSDLPKTLIRDINEADPVSVIYAYPKAIPRGGPAGPDDPNVAYAGTMFSWAPLQAVKSATVFHRKGSAGCEGILLEYDNRGQRAVGQCRVGVDASVTYATPSFLCTLGEAKVMRRSRVVGFAQSGHHHDEGGWSYHAMSGVLKFWFTYSRSCLDVCPA